MGAILKYLGLLFFFTLFSYGDWREKYQDPAFDLTLSFRGDGIHILRADQSEIKNYPYDFDDPHRSNYGKLGIFINRYIEVSEGVKISRGANVVKGIEININDVSAVPEEQFKTLVGDLNLFLWSLGLGLEHLKISLPFEYSSDVRRWTVESLLGSGVEGQQRRWSGTESEVEGFVSKECAENGQERLPELQSGLLVYDRLKLSSIELSGAFLTPRVASGLAEILSKTHSENVTFRFDQSDVSADFFGVLEKSLHVRKISELKITRCDLTDRYLLPYRDENGTGTLYHLLNGLKETCRVLDFSGWDRDALPLPEDYQERCRGVQSLRSSFEGAAEADVPELLPVKKMVWLLAEFDHLEELSLESMRLTSDEFTILAQIVRVLPIRYLDLSKNIFYELHQDKTGQGQIWMPKKLLKSLQEKTNLRFLGLKGTGVNTLNEHSEVQEAIETIMTNNPGIRITY